jgi:hypothetical protein
MFVGELLQKFPKLFKMLGVRVQGEVSGMDEQIASREFIVF